MSTTHVITIACENVDDPENIECKGTSGYTSNNLIEGTHDSQNFNDNRGDTQEERCKENSHSYQTKDRIITVKMMMVEKRSVILS